MGGIIEQLMAGAPAEAAPAAPEAPAELPPSIPDPELGAAPDPMMGGPEMMGAAAPPQGGGSETDDLQNILGLTNMLKQRPSVTHQERSQLEQVTSILQKLLAGNEKMSDQVMGTSPALRKIFAPGG